MYRRHTNACSAKRRQHDRTFWRCKCIIYVEGSIGGRYVRQSLKTRNREQANRSLVAAEARGSWDTLPDNLELSLQRTIASATTAFLEDAISSKGRELATPTFGKYRTLLGRLEAYCHQNSLSTLEDLTTDRLRSFKETWPTGPRATGNNISRLRAFFRFCVDNEWLSRNPALALRSPKHIRDKQKMPFTDCEMAAILQAAERASVENALGPELVALILVMRHTGLRISDAAFLTTDRLSGDHLQLRTQKTGSWVSIPLEGALLERLHTIQPKQNNYFFISGSPRLDTVTALWRRKLHQVFRAAGISGAHPHRFRHTFAVDLLGKGVDIKTVSLLLGHSSVTITEKFYAAWITARQQALSEQVRKIWI